jgi:molecular chaperone GrpE
MASQDLLTKLLPVLDNFELALYAAEETRDYEKLVKGIELVYGEFKDVVQKSGLEVIEAEGKLFNPEVHEAVMQIHSDEHEDNEIVDVLRNGYMFKGRVIRPALVKVAKK